ncbi:MAG: Quinone oxidoreductase 1 [Alphaproteobacteria bacterium MarineAlpha11_Bin1]|nr:MAG: Quinone oxidoreductase 1 [Alphaproteobacteria bacterium MarineAlpha11_Bin1]|tara:strand:+ start:4074 stop:5048 length:975 start_codon:yes stop_codon:yes gene_type:complete
MPKAIVVEETGSPSVMKWRDIEVGRPAKGEVTIRAKAIGVNFIDIYQRSGLYPMALPFTPGGEICGEIEAVGAGVSGFKIGDRVATGTAGSGCYAEVRNVEAGKLVKVPKEIPTDVAASMMLQGMTVQFLIRQVYKVSKGDTILIHAAAGGVGTILCQWASHLGATVIGTVGSPGKARLAKAHGCDYPIIYSRENFVDRVRKITKGEMLPVVYDSIGKATWPASLDCLQHRGLFVTFGNASGPIPPIDPLLLSSKGSLVMTRPTLFHFADSPDRMRKMAGDVIKVIRSGAVKIEVNHKYSLREAARAHRDLAARKTTGSIILEP